MKNLPMMNIEGGKIDAQGVKEVRAAIMEIIKSNNSESVKHDALQVLTNATRINGAQVSYCNFTNKQEE